MIGNSGFPNLYVWKPSFPTRDDIYFLAALHISIYEQPPLPPSWWPLRFSLYEKPPPFVSLVTVSLSRRPSTFLDMNKFHLSLLCRYLVPGGLPRYRVWHSWWRLGPGCPLHFFTWKSFICHSRYCNSVLPGLHISTHEKPPPYVSLVAITLVIAGATLHISIYVKRLFATLMTVTRSCRTSTFL